MKTRLLGTLMLLIAGTSLRADTVILFDTPFDGGMPGGEFTAVTTNIGSFTTFCLEYASPVRTGVPYTYSISNAAVTGGLNHVNTPGYDVLSQGTAHLYTLLHLNLLGGYAATSALHKLNAGYLQEAFWALEDEWTFAKAGGLTNPYLALAIAKFGSFASAQQDYTGTEVRVMNIDKLPNVPDGLSGVHRQDQLVYVPDGGATIALLGLSLLAVAALRMRLT